MSNKPGSMSLKVVQKYFPHVKSVKDAKSNIKIEVTKQDDKMATRKAHKNCAMAVACKRKMKLDGVIISVGTAYMVKGDRATRFHLPERVSREVVSFDRGGGFDTGVYQLDKPCPSNRLGSPNNSRGRHGSKEYTGKVKKHKVLTRGIRSVLGSEVE